MRKDRLTLKEGYKMNIKEAEEMVHLSEDEIESIKRYLGFAHFDINILADFSPETYLGLKDTAWKINEKTNDKIAQNIQDFVNIYAAMYKESKKSNIEQNLVRGTSNKRMQEIGENAPQFLSTTMDEDIAKTFTEYEDDALVYITAGPQVPFLDTRPYKDENVRDEKEIILAPFCQTQVQKNGANNGYTYYQMIVQPPVWEEKSDEELATLYDEIVNNFSQNIKEIQELDYLKAKSENLNGFYQRAEGDLEEQQYILAEQKKVEEEYIRLQGRTHGFKERLQSLLKGLCRQKEIEIDQTYEMATPKKEDRGNKEEESVASEFAIKLAQNPQNSAELEAAILEIYDSFVHTEENAKRILQRFEIEPDRTIADTNAKQWIEEIRTSLREIEDKTSSITAEDERELTSQLDGVSYGVELAKDFPKLDAINRQQTDRNIKKSVYDKVQTVLQNAKMQKYREQRQSIQEERVSFLGKLFGKERLQEVRLRNLDLKMQLAQRDDFQEPEYYSIREMLVDMHICADRELGGEFTPEMQKLYDAMKFTYGDEKTGEFSERYIGQLVSQRVDKSESAGLLVVQEGRTKGIGKTKAQARMLELENQGLQQQLLKRRTTSSIRSNRIQVSRRKRCIIFIREKIKRNCS